jgi:hypothetical protein
MTIEFKLFTIKYNWKLVCKCKYAHFLKQRKMIKIFQYISIELHIFFSENRKTAAG